MSVIAVLYVCHLFDFSHLGEHDEDTGVNTQANWSLVREMEVRGVVMVIFLPNAQNHQSATRTHAGNELVENRANLQQQGYSVPDHCWCFIHESERAEPLFSEIVRYSFSWLLRHFLNEFIILSTLHSHRYNHLTTRSQSNFALRRRTQQIENTNYVTASYILQGLFENSSTKRYFFP